ncbi:MAG: MBL fold metallo-hydrolase [Patescibacteria group bacterium]
MKISKFLHSCILLEQGDSKILFDPGTYCFMEGKVKAEDFKNISGIFITHAHPDHFDIEALKIIIKNNPQCKIYTNSDMGQVLSENGISFEQFEDGEIELRPFKIQAFFAAHAPILKRQMVKNTAFFVNEKFLHPGDSYAESVMQLSPEILALPVAGPWMDMNAGANFTYKCHAKTVLPIHDEHIKQFFSTNMYKIWETGLADQGVKFVSMLNAGDSITID